MLVAKRPVNTGAVLTTRQTLVDYSEGSLSSHSNFGFVCGFFLISAALLHKIARRNGQDLSKEYVSTEFFPISYHLRFEALYKHKVKSQIYFVYFYQCIDDHSVWFSP